MFFTYLQGAFLWSTNFSADTRLEGVFWGNYTIGEEEAGGLPAEITYRRLKQWYVNAGYPTIAAEFYYREKEANRKSLKFWSWKSWHHRLTLELLRTLFGYGERWRRIVIWMAIVILLFGITYFAIGATWTWPAFWQSLYFSAVSFTALGYGSWVKDTSDWIKGLGAFESFLGVSMMALLLVTFVRKWTR